MTRKLALLLVFVMLVSIVAFGCGKKEKPTDEKMEEPAVESPKEEKKDEEEVEAKKIDFGGKTIRFSAWWDHAPGSDEAQDRMADMEARYNCKFEFVNIPWGEYLEKYITAVMAGDAIAEFALVDYVWFYPTLVLNGYVTDITPYAEKKILDFNKDYWNKMALDMGTINGKIYAFSPGYWTYPNNILFWNKSLFEREGLPNLYELFFNYKWTWDKMLEIARKATKDINGDGQIDQWGLVGGGLADAFVISNNAKTVDVSDKFNPKFVLNSPEALQALQTWADWIQVEKVIATPPEGAAWDWFKTAFIEGKVAMGLLELWMIDDVKNNMKDEYGIVLFPMGPNAKEYTARHKAFNVWTIPATVGNKFNLEDLLYFYNEWIQPYPDQHPTDFVENYLEARVSDKESIDTFLMLEKKNLNVFDYKVCFQQLVQMSWSYEWEMANGVKTPQVAIAEIAERAQAVLEEAIKTKPEDIISKENK